MGKKSLLSATALLLLVLSVGCDSSTDPDDDARFTAELTGDGEVPPVDTDATGMASFELDDDLDELDYTLQVTDIESATMAHIHIGPIDDTGPVVAFLFGPVAGGTTVTGTQVLASGTITEEDVLPRPDIGFDGTFASLIAEIEAGNAYVNVHTVAHGPGEIRGQIESVP